MRRRGDNYAEGVTKGQSGDMNALLTFRRRHVGWQRGSNVEDDKYEAVKWELYMRER